ncbi:MAG: tRNA (adenosine(37)-N6)-dimethylallyltransferase MiaA [Terriglobia bacterium]
MLNLLSYDAAQPTNAYAKRTAGRDRAARASAHPIVGPGDSPPAAKASGFEPPLIVIAGPTASGKSGLALYLAERLNGEIINYDSVQVYRGLDIGSGKVSQETRRRIPHHLLDAFEPDEASTAGLFRRMALGALRDLRQRGKLPILAGGTGLYLRALLDGLFEGPERSIRLRERLRRIEARRGRLRLHKMLRRFDPVAASRIHPNDAQKIIRAIEIRLLAGEPASRLYRQGREGLEGFTVVKIGLNPPREELVRRIDRRVERMFASGLIEEAQGVLSGLVPGDSASHALPAAMLALGYRQACAVLQDGMEIAEAIRLTQVATRQYAKRQMTWFRRESDVRWFEGFGDDPAIKSGVMGWLRETIASGTSGPAG